MSAGVVGGRKSSSQVVFWVSALQFFQGHVLLGKKGDVGVAISPWSVLSGWLLGIVFGVSLGVLLWFGKCRGLGLCGGALYEKPNRGLRPLGFVQNLGNRGCMERLTRGKQGQLSGNPNKINKGKTKSTVPHSASIATEQQQLD